MGQRILAVCDVCGIKKEMSVGAGLMTNNPDMIASCLNGEEAEAWKSLYSQRKVESFRASQKVFCCDHCRDLRCQLTVSATLTDGTEVTFGDKCAKCHGENTAGGVCRFPDGVHQGGGRCPEGNAEGRE